MVRSVLKLIKFRGWGSWRRHADANGQSAGVGTSTHTLAVTFQGDNISVAYDGVEIINLLDTGYESLAPFSSGGISADMYLYDAPYTLTVDDVSVVIPLQLPVAQNDSHQTLQGTALVIGAPGVLGNDQNGSSVNLTATLIVGPAHGTLNLSANGAFTYTPTNNFAGADSFTYQANGGTANYGTATVSIFVARPGELFLMILRAHRLQVPFCRGPNKLEAGSHRTAFCRERVRPIVTVTFTSMTAVGRTIRCKPG